MSRAVVLLSGGLDSATALAMARAEGFECHALSVAYGQRHDAELAAARRVASALGAAAHRIVDVPALGEHGGSALTDPRIAVPAAAPAADRIPATYVPARNTVLLALALAWAEVIEAADLFIGINAVDYSGYPDCRPDFVAAFERVANLGTRAAAEGRPFRVRAPLMTLGKAQIIEAGMRLGVDYALTVSCYRADAEGRACASCDACHLRAEGFRAAGRPDPTRYR